MRVTLSRRQFLVSSAVAGLSACSQDGTFYGAIWPTAKRIVVGGPDQPIDREKISDVPLASISARIGRNERGMMVLLREQGGRHYWYANNRLVLVTRRGRLVQTAGLPSDLRNITSTTDDPIGREPHRTQVAIDTRFTYEVEIDGAYEVLDVRSRLEPKGEEEITISGLKFNTLLLVERCEAKKIGWTFRNKYWVDPYDGLIWKSIQHFNPHFPAVSMETLKPPA